MMTVPIDIVGGSNPGRYPRISQESTYNMIVSDNALVPFAGYLAVLAILTQANARQIYVSPLYNRILVVFNESLYALSSDLSYIRVGQLDTSNGSVEMAENANSQIGIVDGLNLYVYNYVDNSFLKKTESELGFRPVSITEQDSYLIIAADDSNQFFVSEVNDAFTYPITQMGEIGGDRIVAVQAHERQLFVFGQRHTELWRDAGLQIMPYVQEQTMGISYGCLQKDTIAAAFGLVVWLGASDESNAVLLYSDGSQPKEFPVSDGIDFKINQLTDPSNSSAFLFQADGHTFYQITFETDNLTLVFDFKNQKFFYATDENLNNHIAKKAIHFSGNNYFIAFGNDPNLYRLSSTLYTYNGATIPRIRITKPHRRSDHKFFKINELEVMAATGYTAEPLRIQMATSKDGGVTFGNYVSCDTGPLGALVRLLRWFQLGYAYDWVFQFRFYGQDRFTILGAQAKADLGQEGVA